MRMMVHDGEIPATDSDVVRQIRREVNRWFNRAWIVVVAALFYLGMLLRDLLLLHADVVGGSAASGRS